MKILAAGRWATLVFGAVFVFGLSGCNLGSATCVLKPAPLQGRLIIAGGGTSAENEELYSRFMSSLPADAVIGVLPTASGVPEESAASSSATLKRYAGERTVRIIDISIRNPGRARDPAFVGQIEECHALWFTGGDQSRIISEFRPVAKDAPGYAAARRVLEVGGVIGGTSAGAAMMSDPMIIGGSSEDALSGRVRSETGDSGFDTGKGMGFFQFGLTDQHFLRRGRFGRLVVALERTGTKRGYGIEENCALEVDCRSGHLVALGPAPAVVIVNMSEASVDSGVHRGVRISLLCDQDAVDAKTDEIRPLASRKPVSKIGSRRAAPLPEAWSSGALTLAVRALAADPARPVVLRSKSFTVTLTADDKTRFYADERAPELVTATGILLEIVNAGAD